MLRPPATLDPFNNDWKRRIRCKPNLRDDQKSSLAGSLARSFGVRCRSRGMSKNIIRWRIAGPAMLAGIAGIGVARCSASPTPAGHAASLELVFGLTGFVLACLVAIRIIHGAQLRNRGAATCGRKARDRAVSPDDGRALTMAAAEIDPVLLWDPGFGGGRLALATFLVLRAQQRAAQPVDPAKLARHLPLRRHPQLQRESD